MASIDAGDGVVVHAPDDIEIRVVEGPASTRARRGAAAALPATEVVVDALSDDFTVARTVELAPRAAGTRALRGAVVPPTIEVTVDAAESALVLAVGEGGVHAWVYPRVLPSPMARRGGRPQRTLTFSLGAPPPGGRVRGAAAGPGARRGAVLDWIVDHTVEPVRAYVLKFAVTSLLDLGVNHVEGDMPTGLAALAGDDPTAWRPGGAPLPALRQDRPANILLMVHGTFSSTAGGFGQLTTSPEGLAFLAAARARYDAVLGCDHKTLALDPLTNARAMLTALEELGLPENSTIDAVAHSRGGLVYRAFAEEVLATARPDIRLRTAAFVACTNAGTHLAEPKNWATLIDLYTNLALAAARVGGAASPALRFGIRTLGRFVQLLSEVAIVDNHVPGLAAMEPGSALIKQLNDAAGGLERLASYCAVSSSFSARREPRNGLSKEIAEFLIDRVTDRLFQQPNDLVVDTASMATFGTRQPRFAADRGFSFGEGDTVYHTVYFATRELPGLLTAWLGLPAPQERRAPPAAETAPPVRRTRGAKLKRPPGVREFSLRGDVRPGPDSLEKAAETAAAAVTDTPCYFAAEMEPSPPLKQRVPLFVTIARTPLEVAASAAAAASATPVAVDAARPIEVEVIARRNCRVHGPTVITTDVPAGEPRALRFVVEGLAAGTADILVEARQGAHMLVSFVLAPTFIATEPGTLRVTGTAMITPANASEPAVLRIYEIADATGVRLRFDLACLDPNIAVTETTRTLPASFSREAFATKVFKDIENAWGATSRIYDQFVARLQAAGTVMANELLPEAVRVALWRHRARIRAIQVVSEEPFIPWELFYITDPEADVDEGRGFLSEWGLVRWLHNTPWPDRRLALGRGRVRHVIPDYADPGLALAGVVQERDMLGRMFDGAQAIPAESVTVSRFLQQQARDCDLLHFACHGEAQQLAVLSSDLLMSGTRVATGYARDTLTADHVKANARFTRDGIKPIVFVNACQTGRAGTSLAGVGGFASAFLSPISKAGAGAFIGALWQVDDQLALTFAETFYSELKKGQPLVEAARAARTAAKTRQEFTWLAYTVYGNPFARLE
jgi:hypothetical protein